MGHRLAELARVVGGRVEGDGERLVTGLATLEAAGPEHLSFLTNPKYLRQARASRAGALLVGADARGLERDLLVAEDPYYALAQLLEHLYPVPETAAGIDPTARVAPGARVDPTASVGAYAVVGEGSTVEAGAVLEAHVVVGRRCRVGAGTLLHPGVVLYDRTLVGERCIVHSGVVLGSDGFGYASRDGEHRKLRQVGRVVVEDDVEIGANSAVDRAMLEETRIGAGSKLDNLVQLGHNVRLGRGCLLISQVGIAGSTRLGDGVVMGGQAGAAGHLRIGDGAQVGAKSAVFQAVEAGRAVAGIPAIEFAAWRRQQALTRRLREMMARLRALERRLGGDEERGDE